jgi:hypothetical protein
LSTVGEPLQSAGQDIATRDANTSDDFSMTVRRRTFSGNGAREDDAGFK